MTHKIKFYFLTRCARNTVSHACFPCAKQSIFSPCAQHFNEIFNCFADLTRNVYYIFKTYNRKMSRESDSDTLMMTRYHQVWLKIDFIEILFKFTIY